MQSGVMEAGKPRILPVLIAGAKSTTLRVIRPRQQVSTIHMTKPPDSPGEAQHYSSANAANVLSAADAGRDIGPAPTDLTGESAPRLFRPSAASLNWVISIGFASLGYAMYLRYLVIEQSSIGIACDTGLKTWLCFSRGIVSAMFNNEVFGWVSVGAAVLTLIRPSVPLFTIAL